MADVVACLEALDAVISQDDDFLDAESFSLFDVAARHLVAPAAASAKASRLILALAERATPREVFCMIMDAFAKHPTPPAQLKLLCALKVVLPRLTRKRSDFLATCLNSLSARYLDHWPAGDWDDLQEEEEATSEVSDAWSAQLLPALLDCVVPLAAEVEPAGPPKGATSPVDAAALPPAQAGAHQARRLVLGFLFRVLDLPAATSCRDRALQALHASAPRVTELEAAVAAQLAAAAAVRRQAGRGTATAAASSGTLDECAPLSATEQHSSDVAADPHDSHDTYDTNGADDAGVGLARWPLGGVALYTCSILPKSPQPLSASPLARELDELSEPLRRFKLLSQLAHHLLQHRGARAAAGHALFAQATRSAVSESLILGDSSVSAAAATAAAAATEAVRALMAHMATATQQAERSGAYATLREGLWLWAPEHRLALLKRLVETCPHPNVVALLVHRLKEEHLTEGGRRRQDVVPDTAASSMGAPVFTAAALLEIVGPLLVLPERADPLDSLDAWVGALNLVRLLLARAESGESAVRPGGADAHAAISQDAIGTVLTERLRPLDAGVRRRMDVLWAEIQAAELLARGGGKEEDSNPALLEMRMDFTRLHVAAEVATRTVEVAAEREQSERRILEHG